MSEAYQSTPYRPAHTPYVLTLNRCTVAETHQAVCSCGWTSGMPFNRYELGRALRSAGEHADRMR